MVNEQWATYFHLLPEQTNPGMLNDLHDLWSGTKPHSTRCLRCNGMCLCKDRQRCQVYFPWAAFLCTWELVWSSQYQQSDWMSRHSWYLSQPSVVYVFWEFCPILANFGYLAANLRTWCTFAGLNNAVVSKNLVSYPSRWSFSFRLGPLYWSSS